MFRALLLTVAAIVAVANAVSDGSTPQCNKVVTMKCSNDQEKVDFATKHPRECAKSDCLYRPKRGYTENPDGNMKVMLAPQNFTKTIVHSFKSYEAKVCIFRNQMCYCSDPHNCKCNTRGASFCRQKYRTVKGYFLVVNKEAKVPHKPMPSYPKKYPAPVYPAPYYKPSHYYPTPPPPPPSQWHHYPPKYPQTVPPTTTTTTTTAPPATAPTTSGGGQVYHIPGFNSNGGQSDGVSDMINSYSMQSNRQRSLLTNLLSAGVGMPNSMNPMGLNSPFGLLGLLNKDGKDDDKKNKFLEYFLIQQFMKQRQQYRQHYYPPFATSGQNKTAQPKRDPPTATQVGTVFDPSILMYMLSKNGGEDKSGLLKLLPFLTMSHKMGYSIKLEFLYVKIPNDCSCERDKSYHFDPLLKYFFMHKLPFAGYNKPPKSQYSKPQRPSPPPPPPPPPPPQPSEKPMPPPHPQGGSYWSPFHG